MARQNFAAEVLDGARKKAQSLRPDSFTILVTKAAESPVTPGSLLRGRSSTIDGVVEVALQDDEDVLAQLPGGRASQYAYLSSMAVAPELRRMGGASALLAAAEQQAGLWGQQWLALHVYANNRSAVQLYNAAGMQIIGQDPAWRSWIGGKVRILMAKRIV